MSNSEQTFTDSKSIPSPVTSFLGFCGEFPIVYPMVSKWTRVAPIYLLRIMLMTLANVMFVFDTSRRKKILPVIGGKTDWEIRQMMERDDAQRNWVQGNESYFVQGFCPHRRKPILQLPQDPPSNSHHFRWDVSISKLWRILSGHMSCQNAL